MTYQSILLDQLEHISVDAGKVITNTRGRQLSFTFRRSFPPSAGHFTQSVTSPTPREIPVRVSGIEERSAVQVGEGEKVHQSPVPVPHSPPGVP